MSGRFKLTIQTDQLRAHLNEAQLIVRLGAVANAVLYINRAFRSNQTSLAKMRDDVQYAAFVASYATEATRIIGESDLTWELAAAGVGPDGLLLPGLRLSRLRSLLTADSAFFRACAAVRDKHAFHIDKEPVHQWLKSRPTMDGIVLQTVEERTFEGCLFDASAQIVRSGLPSASLEPEFTNNLATFGFGFPFLVRAVIAGFARTCKVDVTKQGLSDRPPYLIYLRPLPNDHSPFTVAIEIRPHNVTWDPFFAGTPLDESGPDPQLRAGPRQDLSSAVIIEVLPALPYDRWWIRLSRRPATSTGDSHFMFCARVPEAIIFGRTGGPQYNVLLKEYWGPVRVDIPPTPTVTG